MPGWIGYIAIVAALLAAVTVQAAVSVKSTQGGDGLPKMWAKSGCMGVLAMIGVMAAFILIGNLASWFRG